MLMFISIFNLLLHPRLCRHPNRLYLSNHLVATLNPRISMLYLGYLENWLLEFKCFDFDAKNVISTLLHISFFPTENQPRESLKNRDAFRLRACEKA
jgi:hypothetical protein